MLRRYRPRRQRRRAHPVMHCTALHCTLPAMPASLSGRRLSLTPVIGVSVIQSQGKRAPTRKRTSRIQPRLFAGTHPRPDALPRYASGWALRSRPPRPAYCPPTTQTYTQYTCLLTLRPCISSYLPSSISATCPIGPKPTPSPKIQHHNLNPTLNWFPDPFAPPEHAQFLALFSPSPTPVTFSPLSAPSRRFAANKSALVLCALCPH
ncbi:hypothetical protein EJ04DRAFT_191564 [Polyplosphaeria fusca]|uniref:Uncharacterized protein n=1 Tax=Polyplosphaeria fusca TaxID=682080 RepID=A0A9P4V405_9PLEO|nr:hypothetical protein EJ04DRAFT_191564 [Polyplosphaeria fusca]